MIVIQPPSSDDALARHNFDAAIAARLNYDAEKDEIYQATRARLHQRVDEVDHHLSVAKDELAVIQTKARTFASIAVGLWAVLGGLLSWSLDRAVTNLDGSLATLSKLERKVETLTSDITTIQAQKDVVSTLQRVLNTTQTDLEDLKRQLSELKQSDNKGK